MTRDPLLGAIQAAAAEVRARVRDVEFAREYRYELIRNARAQGFSLREIGEAADLHYTAILKIARKEGTR